MVEELSIKYYFSEINDFILPQIFNNVSYPWELLKKNKQIIQEFKNNVNQNIRSEVSDKCTIKDWVYIGENTKIDPYVLIEGPAIIGNNCSIKQGALVRPGSIISDNCILGHGCEVKNSLVFKGAKIQSLTFVGDSVVGRGARVGSGTITANRRFDQNNIGIKFNQEYYDFETDFFGCILGDYCRLGANSTTLPGTLVGPYTWIMPLTRISGFVQKAKLVSTEQNLTIRDNSIRTLKE